MRIIFGVAQHFSVGCMETLTEGACSQTGNDITLNYTFDGIQYIEKMGK
jgi:hypothetical protein